LREMRRRPWTKFQQFCQTWHLRELLWFVDCIILLFHFLVGFVYSITDYWLYVLGLRGVKKYAGHKCATV
jgi:hypothetical protein